MTQDYRHELDRRDVAAWLRSQHPGVPHHLMIGRAHTAPEDTLALVDVRAQDRSAEAGLRKDAVRAFEALGYRVRRANGDVYEVPVVPGLGVAVRVAAAISDGSIPPAEELRRDPIGTLRDDF